MATQLHRREAEAMKDKRKQGLQLTPGILRAALGLGLLSGIAITPLPAQLSMGRSGFTRVPPPNKRTTAPAKPGGGSTQDADKRLADAIQNLTPKDRRRLNTAMKRLSPGQRAQAIDAMKRRFASRSRATGTTPRK
jgi:hypothetical protein